MGRDGRGRLERSGRIRFEEDPRCRALVQGGRHASASVRRWSRGTEMRRAAQREPRGQSTRRARTESGMTEENVQDGRSGKSSINVAVVGAGYWGKNLVRNFHDLGVLALVCDANRSLEAGCRHDY